MTINDANLDSPDIASDLLAHDLRAAAAGIVSSLGLIGAAGLSGAERRSLRQARVAAATLNDLLDLSMGLGVATPQEVSLLALARRIDDRWRDSAVEKGISLRITLGTDAPAAVHCAPAELNRILDNILGNALKYCDNGEVRAEFNGTDDGGLTVTIDDDGPGFSDAALCALFALRGRPTDARKDGTGLGLYITKSIVDRMSGEIHVQNRPFGGARVTLGFPAALCRSGDDPDHTLVPTPDQAPAIPTSPGNHMPGSSLPDLSHLSILVAEDNLTNQLVVSQMLEAMGAHFVMASDGIEAIEALETDTFDLALLDIEMPRMTGLDVMRHLRACPDSRASMPIVALTAYAMPDHVRRIMDVGASGLIAKPLTSIAEFGTAILGYTTATLPPARATTPDPESGQLHDLSVIDRRIFDSLTQTMGPAGMRELLSKITIDLQKVLAKLREGQAQEGVEQVRSATHILISLAGAIGGTGLQHLSQELNVAVKAEPWPKVALRLGRLIAGVDDLLGFVAKEALNW